MLRRTVILLALAAAAPAAAERVVPVTVPTTRVRLVVDGAVSHPLALDAAGFAALPHAQLTATVHGALLTCSGVWLTDLAIAAGVPTGEALRGAALASVIVAAGADGYRVAFSLGELDRSLGRAQILVADRCNGAVLPDGDGPWRLVAAGDIRGARSVRALVHLTVAAVPPVVGRGDVNPR